MGGDRWVYRWQWINFACKERHSVKNLLFFLPTTADKKLKNSSTLHKYSHFSKPGLNGHAEAF